MLRAHLFDDRHGAPIEDWAKRVRGLTKKQVLWLDLHDASAAENEEVETALGISGLDRVQRDGDDLIPALEQHEGYIVVTAVGVSAGRRGRESGPVAIVCFVGENWVVSAHTLDVDFIDEFRERAEGGGELGALDAPSFLADLLEWVVTSYLRAFDRIDLELEQFDLQVLESTPRRAEQQIGLLVDARSRVSRLRRALAPHRDVFAALSHSEFDPISTEESAARFTDLAAKVNDALTAARDTKDAVNGSFDILLARTGYRTNETMKILTLASVLLLPGALLAGVAGMNVNISLRVFAHSPLFWIVCATIVTMAAATVAVARGKRWL